jgi:tRNA(fMet)-specific endonuclease VapC
MKRYMMDTDTSSYIIRNRPESVRVRFGKLDSSQVCISVITHAELLYGVKSMTSTRTIRPAVEDFVRRLTVLEWDSAAAEHYADIRVKLETGGTPIGNMDMMIAAHARSVSAVMVTNNEKHFRRVSALTVENWV